MQNEREYLRVLAKVLEQGDTRPDRTGTGTLSLFGEQMRFDISESVPVLTTKRVPWKSCVKELLWFCRGETDSKILSSDGVKIWEANTSRKFLDARGLYWLPEGDIGAGYGWQWRHAGADIRGDGSDGYDQLAEIERLLKAEPHSRRIFMSAWSPKQLELMALPPCHLSCQFYVSSDGGLSCHMYQRSCDMFLGVPWNILSYSVLTYVLAARAGLKPKELIVSCGDVHVYRDHLEQAREQLSREPMAPPSLKVDHKVVSKEWADINIDDFELVGYESHPAIKAHMSA
jgi:thymidylate synthase